MAPALFAASLVTTWVELRDHLGGRSVEFWVLSGIGVAALVVALFRVGDRRAAFRLRMVKAAAAAESLKLGRLSALFIAVGIGHRTGTAREIKRLAYSIRKPGGVEEIAASIIEAAGPAMLEHPTYGPRIRKALGGVEKPAAASRQRQTAEPAGL